MTPRDGLAHFAALAPSNIKMGLTRVRAALSKLGDPQNAFPALHVAGTNGKGSTCAIAASLSEPKQSCKSFSARRNSAAFAPFQIGPSMSTAYRSVFSSFRSSCSRSASSLRILRPRFSTFLSRSSRIPGACSPGSSSATTS